MVGGLKDSVTGCKTATMNELKEGSGGRGCLFILFVLNKFSTRRRAWARYLVIRTIEDEGSAIELCLRRRFSKKSGVSARIGDALLWAVTP